MFAKPVIKDQVLTAGAQTNIHGVEVNFDGLGDTREFVLSGKTVQNATGPGAARTFDVNWFWSDEKIDIADVAAKLANRKSADTTNAGGAGALGNAAVPIPNTADAVRYWQFSAVLRPQARYLYINIDKTTEDANATTTLTVWISKVRPTAGSI
jgi:hypothetical protein